MGFKSRDPQKAHLGPLPNFSFLAQFIKELYEEQTQKIRKNYQTTTSSEL